MDLQELILSRRSVRKYTDKEIGKQELRTMLEAAMAAPSAVAKDPWRFYAVKDRRKLNRMAAILPHGKMLKQAGAAVMVCGRPSEAHLGDAGYMVQDCSAAVENLLLSARGMGIGAVWLGVYPNKDRMDGLKEEFSLPGDLIPLAVISLGYPGETPSPRTRYDESKVNWVM